ncbi:iron uptake porin [Geitlerinema sp. PCC 9228]|uniref:iron uptake porin n=1 Tax=Geitlerinema sp. PCC 9228 TaxID=111611 RepID=UPI0008F9C09D|nr:iron uptake porin [Geitlerinema sp. PCC 9228]
MSQKLRNSLLAAPILLGMTCSSVAAAPEGQQTKVSQLLSETEAESQSMGQVTSVSQLRDVQPTDWAFQALQSLVERYGCIAGYPDRTFRGNRAMTRYEFAAGLNACMEVMTQLIEQSTADLVRQEDLATLQRLQEEFQAELATLRGRVDSLEARTAELEANQFSTTTKLNGEAKFFLGDAFGGEDLNSDIQTTFSGMAELTLDSSFTGRDRLRTRLLAGNIPGFGEDVTGTNMAFIDDEDDSGLAFELDEFYYRFPLGDNLRIWVTAVGTDIDDIFSEDAFVGGPYLSEFADNNTLFDQTDGAGVGANFKFSENLGLDVLYMADEDDASEPGLGEGIFNGPYSVGAQLNFAAGKLDASLSYLNTFNGEPGGGTGSAFADDPFAGGDLNSHHIGLQTAYRLSSKFHVGAFGGVVFSNQTDSDNDATIWTAALQLSFPDLGGEGNVAGISVGIPPKASDNDFIGREDEDTSVIVDVAYEYALTDNISLTPGVIWVINPEHNDNNEDIVVGALKTTFEF